ncbi:MAG: peptidyl-prolyl cis-trans isomerase [Verrucomicrobiaceae bacterium]|nr:peptidyl-prolyl cis-trans isomerase [Verrucomicrobiaceae bacterium]
MLEFFRRHRGAFLITLTIIIIVSFSVWGGYRGIDKDAQVRALPTDHALTVFGKDYTIAEASQVSRSLQFAMQHMSMFDLYIKLAGLGPKDGGFGQEKLISTALAVRHVLEETGIRASDKEALDALQRLPSLQTNGQFDASQGQRLEETAGMYGMTASDLLDIMRLKIGLTKLEELVAKNYAASSIAAEKQYASSQQTLKLSTIAFNTDDFKKDIKVTDEEIKKSYDEAKENYKTAEKRAVKYVFFKNLDPKEQEKITLPEREKAKTALAERINKFSEAVLKADRKADLEAIAKELKEKVESVPAFAQDAAPEALKTENELIKAVFELPHKVQPVSDAIKTEKGWYFFSVPAVEEPKQQELAEVKDKIKDNLVTQKAAEARSKAVNDVRDFLVAGLKDKKKIDDLVKEKKLTLTALADINNASPPAEVPNAAQIAQAAAKTAVGQISQAVDTDKGTVLVFVNAKELRKSDNSTTLRKQQADSLSSQEREGLFQAWFARKLEEAAIKTALREAA